KNGGGTVQMVTATASDWNQPIATATCPSGKKVTGGGGMCSFSNAILKRSSPSGNSAWVAGCSQNTNQISIIQSLLMHCVSECSGMN
ncbi:TPA: hypothetical protein ACPTQR_005140, partial [Escherichia coli]